MESYKRENGWEKVWEPPRPRSHVLSNKGLVKKEKRSESVSRFLRILWRKRCIFFPSLALSTYKYSSSPTSFSTVPCHWLLDSKASSEWVEVDMALEEEASFSSMPFLRSTSRRRQKRNLPSPALVGNSRISKSISLEYYKLCWGYQLFSFIYLCGGREKGVG